MYHYTLDKHYSPATFMKGCSLLEQLEGIAVSGDLLTDHLDGSMIQVYAIDGKQIRIEADFMVDAVWVDSEIPLAHLFPWASLSYET